jgi:Arc-like DNA binding domain
VSDRYRYLLRMPHELRERIVRSAEKHGRSFNSEVLHRLEQSLRPSLGRRIADRLGAVTRSIATGTFTRKPQGARVQRRGDSMQRRRRRRIAAAAAVAVAVLAAAITAGLLTRGGTTAGSGSSALVENEGIANPLGLEAYSFIRSAAGQSVRGVPLPMAREKIVPGREATREFVAAAQEAYEDLAYPHKTVAVTQQQGALAAMRSHQGRAGGGLRWDEVGPFTLDVAREATQNNGLTTQWSGRMTAMAVDPTCNEKRCRLYVGAAGGGVWRTNDALARKPRWESLENGLDTTSIGALFIDPNDPSGRTIYVGTGEPSGSGDSEAGLGLYRSTDRGEHWRLVPGSFAVAKDRGIGEVVVDPQNPRHIWIGTTVARHSLSGVSGGRFTPPGAPTIGLYESTDGGSSFRLRFNLPQDPVDPTSATGNDFFKGGVTDIEYDPADPTTFYFTMFDYGVFRATGNGATIQNIYEGAGPDELGFGIRYEVAAARLANGRTRLYIHDGRNEVDANGDGVFEDASRVLRTDDARAATPAFQMLSSEIDGTPGFSSFDVCAAQCSYDMPIAVSPRNPDVVMIGGQTQYGELPPYAGADRSNGRNIMLSRNGGVFFTDMSGEAKDPFEANHPDVQVLAFHPTNPNVLFIGSDGGIVRTSGRYVNDSSDCDEPDRNLSGVDLTDCQLWLSSIPTDLTPINAGLRTLQFQDLSPNPNNPLRDVIGGTQDNGTLGFDGTGTWLNFVSGDGGQSGIDARQGNIRYHTYFAQQGDVNFRGNDPQWWSWIFDPILFSPEASAFYIPFAADPNVGRTAFAGSESVWRTQNAGGEQDFLENHCSVLGGPRSDRLNTGVDSGCGDWVKLGPGAALSLGANTPTDKGGASGVSYVVAVERAKTNTGTLWAGTRRGRIWITKNADANDPAAVVQEPDCCGTGMNERQSDVVFTRIDTPAQPRRFPSGISVDPRDTTGNTAFISFSGYEAYSPGQPGHVFKVVFNPATGSATWTDLSHDLGDLPITDVELDAATGDLYASFDWGVLRLRNGSTNWEEAGSGLPKVATYELSQANLPGGRRVIYAATHGRGGFRLILSR